jgi:hypothetical protein
MDCIAAIREGQGWRACGEPVVDASVTLGVPPIVVALCAQHDAIHKEDAAFWKQKREDERREYAAAARQRFVTVPLAFLNAGAWAFVLVLLQLRWQHVPLRWD